MSIVTNFSKPGPDAPSLLTHDELTTFLHEFGHALHGMLAEGRYPSMTGTNVARDFVELPSQLMENWAFEPGYLRPFYFQVRQLRFGLLDLAWHTLREAPADTAALEQQALAGCATLPDIPGSCISTAFSHIFSGGYSAGYYSYKWAEVLEADAFSLFQEKGIFSREAADAFRANILSRGSSEDEAVLYRRFRGHEPDPDALLKKLEII